MRSIEYWRRRLQEIDQQHVLRFWETLSPPHQTALLEDLERVDWRTVAEQADPTDDSTDLLLDTPEPPDVHTAPPPATREHGLQLLRDGAVAALTVAGGQGTRLGFDGPKGLLPISPVRGKSLFQIFAESILATDRLCDCRTPWYIMTSPENRSSTAAHFREHGFFGLQPQQVHFFVQGTMPALSPAGKVLLRAPHALALSPDGHGGTIAALQRCGGLARLRADGVTYVSYFQVDNPLVRPLDPSFLGLVHERGAEAGSKVIRKAHDDEKVGVFVRSGGATRVVEYINLPAEWRRCRNPDGSRRFDLANMAVHVFSTAFLERLSEEAGLPWHRAHRKITGIESGGDEVVEPQTPNAFKLERFIFDALPLSRAQVLYEVPRAEEFSPVKNASGEDSPERARQDQIRRAWRWLQHCGVNLPSKDDAALPVVEVSPLFALDAEQLSERLAAEPALDFSRPLYLGD